MTENIYIKTNLLLYFIIKTMNDIRWIQRLSNYQKALSNLEEAVELAWNTIKD